MSHHPIKPPAPEISEIQHVAAYRKWCLEIVIEMLSFLKHDIAKERSTNNEAIGRIFPKSNNFEDFCNEIEPYESWKKNQIKYLQDIHGGDCTALPGSCIRCHTEDLYELESTVTWKGKHEGSRLFAEYRKLNP